MNSSIRASLAAVTVLAAFMATVHAAGEQKFSAYAFSDVYYIIQSHHDAVVDDVGKDIEGDNGVWFRRIYLTYDKNIQDGVDARLRLEMGSKGDFETSATLEPFAKDAYLKWKSGGRSWYFGLSGTPTWGVVEKHWGYRSVEKTPMDLQKFGSSRDIGIAVKGALDEDKTVGYHLMAGNGAGTKSEVNNEKKLYASVYCKPADGAILEIYGDYEAADGDKDKYTFQAFAGFGGDGGRVGLQYVHQVREQGSDSDLELDIASIYAVGSLSENVDAFARVDFNLDPNPKGEDISYIPFSDKADSTFALVGLDFEVAKNVHVMPNLEAVFYDDAVDGAPDPDDDLIGRITVYYKY